METGEIILKVVNLSGEAQHTDVSLDGAAGVASDGTAIVLTSNSPDDENSFAHPAKVAPVAMPVKGLAPTFRHTFLPRSLTVLRIRAER